MERVANLWKAVDWESVQARVDAEIKAIEDREICAEEGRKILLDESNKYRQNTDKEQRRIAVPLIKTFQKEVDQLTTRGKTAEAALISLCQRLTELPDPTPYIEQAAEKQKALDRARIAEEERDELREQIQQLSDEFSHLQNQDVTLRQLRERIKQLESEKETEVTESANQTEKALREEFALKEKEMSLKTEELRQENGILEKKVSELEVRMKDSQRRLDTVRVEQQQKGVLESEQNELLNRDLNDANRRIISLESEVARLTSELVEAQANAPRTGIEDIAALGSLLKGKDEQIARVTEENRKIREKLQAEEAKSRERMAEMRKEVERYSHIVESLNAELAKKADYDQIQQELRILRQMEFGCTDDMEEAPQPSNTVASSLENTLKTLDQLLVDKSKKLQADNAQLRTANEQLTANLQSATGEVHQLKEDNGRLKDLVERLESDLTRASRPVAVVGALQSEASLGTLDALADCVSAGEAQQNTADGTSFAQIVAAQRDRLKQKLIIAEEERADEKARNALLQSEVEKLREDNVKLFGKIRFLQSYGSGKSNEVRMDMTEVKYTEQYENRLDPFRKFNQTESMRGLSNLKVHERASLSIGRAILTSSSARLTFFAYLLVLHLLVFLVLYRFAYTEACERDFQQDCVERFQSHMKQHHPEHPDVPHQG